MQITIDVTKQQMKSAQETVDRLMKKQGLDPELERYKQNLEYIIANSQYITEEKGVSEHVH